MGGNQKNRTKGNVKPSSSGRAAELLAADSSHRTLIGFGSSSLLVKENPFELNTDDVETKEDNNLRLIFKRMSKKDSVTKIKALKDFLAFSEAEEIENVKSALPYWSKIYPKLALDCDWTVRENCFKAMHKLVLKLKKEIAPFLKQLMPIWLMSLHDPYGPAAFAAKTSLEAAFPGEKMKNALIFTKNEVLKFCVEELLRIEVKASSKKPSEFEYASDCAVSIKSSCLGTLHLIVCQLNAEDEVEEKLAALLSSPQFWKLKDCEETCSMWYNLIRALYKTYPSCISQYNTRICRDTFTRISEKNAKISLAVWKTLAVLVDSIENCWSIVDLKRFVNDLQTVLKKGGSSSCSVLPFVSDLVKKMPSRILTEELMVKILQNLNHGLRAVELIKNDFDVACDCYFDCLASFVSCKAALSSEGQMQLAQRLVKGEIPSLLSHYLSSPQLARYCSKFFSETLKLVENSEIPSDIQKLLLECIRHVTMEIFREASQTQASAKFESLCIFFDHLLPASERPRKEKQRVKFVVEASTERKNKKEELEDSRLLSHLYADLLHSVWMETLRYYEQAHKIDDPCLEFACNLSKRKQFLSLLSLKESNAVKELLMNHIPKTTSVIEIEGTKDQLKMLFNAVFAFADVSNSKEVTLKDLAGLRDPDAMELFLTYVNDNQNDAVVDSWIRSDDAVAYVIYAAEEVIKSVAKQDSSSVTSVNWTSLWNCLTLSFGLENLKKDCLNRVVGRFEEAVKNSDVRSVDFVCEVTQNLFAIYKSCHTLESMSNLLLDFFKLSCDQNPKRVQLCQVWCFGLKSILTSLIVDPLNCDIVCTICEHVRKLFRSQLSYQQCTLLSENVVRFMDTIVAYLNNVEADSLSGTCQSNSNEIVLSLLLSMLPPSDSWLNQDNTLSNYVLYLACLDGSLLFSDNLMHCHSESDVVVPNVVYITITSLKLLLYSQEKNLMGCEQVRTLVNHIENMSVAFSYCNQLLLFSNCLKKDDVHLFTEVIKSFTKFCGTLDSDLKEAIAKQLFQKSLQDAFSALALKHFVKLNELCLTFDYHANIDEVQSSDLLLLFPFIAKNFQNEQLNEIYTRALNTLMEPHPINDRQKSMSTIAAMLKNSPTTNSAFIDLTSLVDVCKHMVQQIDGEATVEREEQLSLATSSAEVILAVVQKRISELHLQEIDFILCCITSWTANFMTTLATASTCPVLPVLLSRLFSIVDLMIEQIGCLPAETKEEWENFYAKKIFSSFLCLFNSHNGSEKLPAHMHWILQNLGSSIVKFSLLPSLTEETAPQNAVNNETTLELTLEGLSARMVAGVRSIYLVAHSLIIRLLPDVANTLVVSDNVEQENALLEPPAPLVSVLKQADPMVDAILSEYKVAEYCCYVDPFTDSYHCIMSYLLNWMQILEYFGHVSPEAKSFLTIYFNETPYFFSLMNNLFRLMPLHEDFPSDLNFIATPFTVAPKKSASSNEIQHLACQLYYSLLKKMPVSVRLWNGNQEKKVSQVVNSFTSKSISSFICSEEFKRLQELDLNNLKNMTIKTRPSAREVVTTYSIEDMSIELIIRLPQNYPINAVVIDGEKRVGISSSQWRMWLLQLCTFLTHQNGSIIDGLLLWNRNINKRFEGLEECMICFYILHGSTCQLPKLSCKHCKKKYHPACLYKWFRTSNNATCPLCRNLF